MIVRTKRYIDWINAINMVIGLGYIFFRYFYRITGDFGPESSPYQQIFQYSHILLVPFLVFGIGLAWNEHIWLKIQSKKLPKRKSGILLICIFIIMSLSGYILQIPLVRELREFTSYIHSGLGLLWFTIFYYHRLK